MTRARWWERPGYSIEREASRFADAGLAFSLDQQLFDQQAVVIFRGELRLGDRRHAALVFYPPAYDQEAQPQVIAPGLPLGRHISGDGALCLDHAVFGATTAMTGAEAVERAERLWHLWEYDQAQLEREEAEAPDPRANLIAYEEGSALVVVDQDLAGTRQGVIRIGVTQPVPLRGGLVGLRVSDPDRGELDVLPANKVFAGRALVCGLWKRIGEQPPRGEADAIRSWAEARHQELIEETVRFAVADRQVRRRPEVPALVGFVYPDEGPKRGEIHDAWLFLLIEPNGRLRLPRPVLLRPDERFLRQPHLALLAQRRVGLVGAGALGSAIAAHLARAGAGSMVIVDHDILTAGNRVRHDLDLGDVGKFKAVGVAQRVLRISPTCLVEAHSWRFGMDKQPVDDAIFDSLVDCDLIINASAHRATGFHVAAAGRAAERPVLHTWVSPGAWGARIVMQRAGSGCTECMGHWQQTNPARIPCIATDPDAHEVTERGCADPTFTGAGFDLAAASAAAGRVAVAELLGAPELYPRMTEGLLTLTFRQQLTAEPSSVVSEMPIHPDCTICHS